MRKTAKRICRKEHSFCSKVMGLWMIFFSFCVFCTFLNVITFYLQNKQTSNAKGTKKQYPLKHNKKYNKNLLFQPETFVCNSSNIITNFHVRDGNGVPRVSWEGLGMKNHSDHHLVRCTSLFSNMLLIFFSTEHFLMEHFYIILFMRKNFT